ncbi:DUF637 domain-containing protein [Vibrio penaeicida]|uniref:DUF637 domain-containing protein n=1 Tax=Vibrio penaeicida TaxID=104609 RepID=A0AAV5NUP6_9VIBR|nr:DUF637 domain-containing protein [Vibrio penaeicida]RTZ19313.1 hypothetical protein EKN09_27625 [Vibrio penaeicida]GLQ73999.1 hypothetical protein GCM10007932_33590 [Vibrio penaeicida]
MKKLIKNALPKMKCNPQKFTANVLLVTLAAQWSMPVYAGIQFAKDVTLLEDSLNAAARLEIAPSNNNYTYKEIFPYPIPDIFDGFSYFYANATQNNAIQFDGMKWIPINVGDITTFIPKAPSKPKFIGTPYVERDVVRLQLNQLLNRSYISVGALSDQPSDKGYNGMIRLLYKNGLEWFKKNPTVKFGQNLTQAQINALPKDMIWPEIRELTTGQEIVIPFVYLTQATLGTKVTNTTLDIQSGIIKTHNFYVDGSNVLSERDLYIRAYNKFVNRRGNVSAEGELIVRAGEVENLSGFIGGRETQLIADKILNETLVYRHNYEHGFSELAGQLATITGVDSLKIQSAGDVIVSGGILNSDGTLQIKANGTVQLLPKAVRQQHAQQGEKWTDSSSSLKNIQTKLSAVDLLSIVSKQAIYAEGALIESEGILELLADMGIVLVAATDTSSYQKTFEASSSGLFGTTEKSSESESRANIVRTMLKAGHSLIISSEFGPVTLQAVNLESEGLTKVLAGDTINFKAYLENHEKNETESYEGQLAFRNAGKGFSKQYEYYNQFVTKGGLVLEPGSGINIEVIGDPSSFDNTLALLKKSPDMSWIQTAEDTIAANPELSLEWQKIKAVAETWDYDNKGLTPAGMAILALAVAAATGGAGIATLGAGTTGLQGALYSALNAGLNAMANQAMSGLLAGKSPSDVLSEMASSESFSNLATAMVTAGVMDYIDTSLMGDVNKSVEQSVAGSEFIDNVVPDFIGDAGEVAKWTTQATNAVLHSVVAANVDSLLSGDGFTHVDDLDKVALNAIGQAAVATVGKNLANQIGMAAKGVDAQGNKTGEDPINAATKYISHAALGCGLGALVTTVNGGDRDQVQADCGAGALGGVIGEFIADEHYRPELEKQTKALEDEVSNFTADTLRELESTEGISGNEYLKRKQAELEDLRKQGVNISKLVAGITVFAAGGDPNIGAQAGGNAAQNNAFFLIPFLIKAALLANAALTAYEVGQTLKKFYRIYKGAEKLNPYDLLLDLAIELGLNVAGKKIPFAKLADKVSDKLKEDYPDLAHHIDELKLSFAENPQTGKVEPTGKAVHEPIEVNGNNIVKPKGMSDTEWDSYREYQQNTPNSQMHPERYKELCEQQNYHPTCNNFVTRDNIVPQKGATIGDPETINIDASVLNSKSREFEVYKNIDNGPLNDKTRTMTVGELLEERNKAKALSETTDTNTLNGANPVNEAAKAKFYASQIGEAAAEQVASDKGWGRPLATVATGQKNGGNYQFDQVYVDGNGKVTIVEAKAGVNATPSKSSHKVGDERFEQGHSDYTNSMLTHMAKRYQETQDPALKRTMRAIKNAVRTGRLEYKVVHQRIDSSGNLGKLTITAYKQDGIEVPTI